MGKSGFYMRLLVFLCLILPAFSFGQVTLQPKQVQTDDVGVVYDKEFAMNFYLHTRGYGLGAIFGNIKTYYKTTFYHVDFSLVKHPKEHRPDNQINQANILSRPYIYGKQNSFFVLRVGKGQKRYLSEKAKRKGIAMGYSWQVGPSLGFLKPYYLDLRTESNTGPPMFESVKYSDETAERFLDPNYIDGYSGFWKGLGEIDMILGAHLKGGAHFAWGAYDKFVKAMEIGLLLDFYFQEVPILADQKNTPIFANLYINLQFGRRK